MCVLFQKFVDFISKHSIRVFVHGHVALAFRTFEAPAAIIQFPHFPGQVRNPVDGQKEGRTVGTKTHSTAVARGHLTIVAFPNSQDPHNGYV